MLEELLKILEQLKAWLDKQKPVEVAKPQPPQGATLTAMCMAIQRHEGWILNPPSRSVRNKNPGNLRFANQVKAIGKDDKNFAIFKTYEDGFQALKNMVLNAAKGGSKIYHPTDNLFDYFKKYAPSSDNNDPIRYAEVVAKAMKVNPATFRLRDLL